MSHGELKRLAGFRRIVAAFTLFALLMAGFGHVCEQQERLSGGSQIAMLSAGSADIDMPDGNTLAGHHCAACTGVVMPAAVTARASDVLTALVFFGPSPYLRPHGPALHTPPPKFQA
jgi:hypothetical protein